MLGQKSMKPRCVRSSLIVGALFGVLVIGVPRLVAAESQHAATRLFDGHIHYSEDVWDALPPEKALAWLERAGIARALVSSTPNEGTERLYALAPDRIVPLLRPYRSTADRATWHQDAELPAFLAARLDAFPYRGIGEFHVFGDDAGSPVVRAIVDLAREHELVLHAHVDEPALRLLLDQAPDLVLIWAHAGFDVPTEELRELLDRHANLYLELSFREGITDAGGLTPPWRQLLTDFSDRVLTGMDTYIPGRWAELGDLAAETRSWLDQLPEPVAERIAFENARRLFPPGP
jgi:hypothetical protein